MRLFIITLSLLSIISFGHALAGYGRVLFNLPIRADYVMFGLLGGFVFGLLALWLFYTHKKDIYIYDEDENNQDL